MTAESLEAEERCDALLAVFEAVEGDTGSRIECHAQVGSDFETRLRKSVLANAPLSHALLKLIMSVQNQCVVIRTWLDYSVVR